MEKKDVKNSRPFIRTINILIHRYLPFLVLAAILSYELVFKGAKNVYGPRFIEATAIIVVAFFLFGKRGRSQAISICIGFVLCWGAYQYSISQCILPPLIIWGLLFVFSLISFFVARKSDDLANLMTVDDLYSERVRDFRKISSYLSNHSVLAIDSPYGNGKSSVVEALRSGPIRDKQTLSFEAQKGSHLEDEYVIYANGLRLLKFAIIFGANASGKSTIIEALDFLYDLILSPNEKKSDELIFTPFLFDETSKKKNTILSIDFLQNDARYYYSVEFNCKMTNLRRGY